MTANTTSNIYSNSLTTTSGTISYGTSNGFIHDVASTGWYNTSSHCANHVLSDELIEYLDGVVVGYCINCQVRITTTRLAGGIHLLRIKDLLARLVIASKGENVSYDLGEYAEALASIKEEEEALAQAKALLEVAHRLLEEIGVEP